MLESNTIDLMSTYRKYLVSVSIGKGLGFFLTSILYCGFLCEPFALAGIVALALGIFWFRKERKKIGIGKHASELTIVLMLATFPLYGVYMMITAIFLQAIFNGLALLFIGSGFFAIGLISVYIDRKTKKLSFFFMILSLLFLICVPIVNAYQTMAYRGFVGYWVSTPYQGYTIPLILASAAFFILGCISILRMKFWVTKESSKNTKPIEKNKTEPYSTFDKREKVIGAVFGVSAHNLGFACLVLGSLSLIGAAIAYAPTGVSILTWTIPSTALGGYTLSLIILGSAFFVLGPAFILYEQTKRGGFFLALSGSFALMVAAFAHGYRTMAVGAFNTGEPYLYPITPLREHTLPIVAVSVFFLVLGYGVMLRRVGLD